MRFAGKGSALISESAHKLPPPLSALMIISRFCWKCMVLSAALIHTFRYKCCIYVQDNTVVILLNYLINSFLAYSKNYDFETLPLPFLGLRYWPLPFFGQRYKPLLIVTTPLPYRSGPSVRYCRDRPSPFGTVRYRYSAAHSFFIGLFIWYFSFQFF